LEDLEAIPLSPEDLAHVRSAVAELVGEGGRPLNDIPDEAAVLRPLMAGLDGRLRPVVLGWVRSLLAERAGLQRIAVWGGDDAGRTADLARRRFGFSAQLAGFPRPEAALQAGRTPRSVAVLALDDRSAWWGRLLAEPRLKVFAVLPELPEQGTVSALCVAEVAVEPTGADETFFVTDAQGSAEAVADQLGRLGFAAELVRSAGGLKLVSLAGYVQADDPRLVSAPGRLTGVIGSAPQPFDPPLQSGPLQRERA
jgi:hypothetical protein